MPVTEPAGGLSSIYALITSAKRAVEMTMYELSDATAEADFARTPRRGVKVEVVLDQNLAKSYNMPAYSYLRAHGVHGALGADGVRRDPPEDDHRGRGRLAPS